MYSKEMIQEFVEKTIVQTIQPEKVILFGSYAYGEPNEDSDIDLLIVKNTSERAGDLFVKIGRGRSELAQEKNINLMCDILIMKDEDVAEEFDTGYGAIYDAITKGIVFYDKSVPELNLEKIKLRELVNVRRYSDEQIREFVDKTIVQTIQPEKVILFGAYAYGEPNSRSDIDLLVIKDASEPRTELYGKIGVSRSEFFKHKRINPSCTLIILNQSQLEEEIEMGSKAMEEAITKGVVLYG